jgi:hypothetical protein
MTTAFTLGEAEFFEQLEVAVSTRELLDLTDQVVCLTKVIRLKRSGSLWIKNGLIVGVASTIFSLGTDRKNGPPALILEGTTLIHSFECQENESPYAAIFAQGKARVELTGVHISSTYGFGLWAKHASQTVLRNCVLEQAGQSAIACFNSALVELTECSIADAAVHGVCVRGTSQVSLTNCQITNCTENAAVVYQQGRLSLEGCSVSKTRNPLLSAIYVEASESYDSASISLKHCQIVENAGSSLLLRGKVSHNIGKEDSGNVIDGVVTLDVCQGDTEDMTAATGPGCDAPAPTCKQLSESTMSETEFEKRMQNAFKTATTLDLADQVVIITKPIQIPKKKHLVIINGTFIGECHSIFLLEIAANSNGCEHATESLPTLSLQGTTLDHLYFSTEKRGIGAAIFVQGRARLELRGVSIKSSFGFGLWMKHEGQALVKNCTFHRVGRSAIACFNNVRVELTDCSIADAAVHGVCVRGTSEVSLTNCQITNCGTRAAFVYQQGSLVLTACSVSGTRNSLTPAIHAEAAGAKDACFLGLIRCKIADNDGPSVVVAGKATHEFLDNDIDENSPPIFAPDVSETTIPRPWAALQSEFNAITLA